MTIDDMIQRTFEIRKGLRNLESERRYMLYSDYEEIRDELEDELIKLKEQLTNLGYEEDVA